MRYLSIDLEATGLEPSDNIIELAMVPFDSETKEIERNLGKHFYIKCPSFETLRPRLNEWVIEHNEELIRKASSEGSEISEVKNQLVDYFDSKEVRSYFKEEDIVLFGKSMSAIDIPFLSRDFGYDFMRKYFSHRTLDLTCLVYALVDMGKLPPDTVSGSKLMEYFEMGEVEHTAMEDAVNTALMYLKIKDKLQK